MTRMLQRVVTLMLALSLLVIASQPDIGSAGAVEGPWQETRFSTGCDPGPEAGTIWPDPIETHRPPPEPSEPVNIRVDLASAANHRPILGTGFNLEHALWSCREFRRLFRTELLDPFRPAIARVDTGLLPAAPPDVPAPQLGPAVYESMLESDPYADSWRFFRRLNRANIQVVLGVWGGPPQFTDDHTRLGVLEPEHYDDYVEYVASVVDFLTRREDISIWAVTIANEPDGGDGNQIPPEGLAYIAHRLAPRLAAAGVKLYGPDTATATSALRYLPPLLDDPVIADNLAFVAFHQYYPSPEVGAVVDMVRSRQLDLPVIVTEYTSFAFGDLDAGEEANDQIGFALDIASTLLGHYRQGADAAIYWDAVDYLQPGHDAITRWGLLRGPARDFARRPRYFGMLQILPYLQPGARLLDLDQQGADSTVTALAVRTTEGAPAIFLVNEGFGPGELTLTLDGDPAYQNRSLLVTRTERGRMADELGRMRLVEGSGQLSLPPRSITTLFPTGESPEPTDADE